MTCTQLRTKTRTLISRKICSVKSGFQILYAVQQFSSLFLKDKLKQGTKLHQAHDRPFPRMSWENRRWCMGAPCFNLLVTRDPSSPRMSWFPVNSSHMCCVELALDRLLYTHLGSKG